jgi:hypothetical protein
MQFADVFTKGLPSSVFSDFRSSLNVRSIDVPTAGGGGVLELIPFLLYLLVACASSRLAGPLGTLYFPYKCTLYVTLIIK